MSQRIFKNDLVAINKNKVTLTFKNQHMSKNLKKFNATLYVTHVFAKLGMNSDISKVLSRCQHKLIQKY